MTELIELDVNRRSKYKIPSDTDSPFKHLRKHTKETEKTSFDWTNILASGVKAAPVSCFQHAPLSHAWETICPIGLKAEINIDKSAQFTYENSYWIATVIDFCGYQGRMRYEGFEDVDSEDKWLNINVLKPIGYCSSNSYPLVPPMSIFRNQKDWRAYVINGLHGCISVPEDLDSIIQEDLQTKRVELGSTLEVLDKNRVSRMRVGTVDKIIGGRVHISYWNRKDDEGFWCHETSQLIHPTGWSAAVGHEISAPADYSPKPFDILPSLYPENTNPSSEFRLEVGMKFECVDPMMLSMIVPASIVKVLGYGYFMARCESEDAKKTSRTNYSFCYHIYSPLIFPCGFCKENDIEMPEPWNWHQKDKIFDWPSHLSQTKSIPLNISANRRLEDRTNCGGFEVGMKLEAVDVMEPRFVAVATIVRIIGRLLKIHFDGWSDAYDQWADCRSCDLFPVGWCELTGYKLEPPGV